jgi:hypothetical protein
MSQHSKSSSERYDQLFCSWQHIDFTQTHNYSPPLMELTCQHVQTCVVQENAHASQLQLLKNFGTSLMSSGLCLFPLHPPSDLIRSVSYSPLQLRSSDSWYKMSCRQYQHYIPLSVVQFFGTRKSRGRLTSRTCIHMADHVRINWSNFYRYLNSIVNVRKERSI